MVDPNEKEEAALRTAGAAAGEYLEELAGQGKTDFRSFSEDEYLTLIRICCGEYTEAMAVPF